MATLTISKRDFSALTADDVAELADVWSGMITPVPLKGWMIGICSVRWLFSVQS
jgi:hypothetical protein